MDAEAIDLPDASVDVVLCRLGLMILPDLDAALASVHRVLAPGGGRLATVFPWHHAGQAVPHLVGVILAALDLPAPPPPAPGRPGNPSLTHASVICAALESAGLVEIRAR
jgi:ubiquinone/menaquinone biosynthesis C-methylase UbiE